jgi:hypothetical protein
MRKLREREKARADLPLMVEPGKPVSSQNQKTVLNNTPIENRSFLSVKKKAPNPQIPEPARMLPQQKNECKSFLLVLLIVRIPGTYSSGTQS